MTTRLNKYLASCGVASRRGAEALIAEGRVLVNGSVADSPGVQIADHDAVSVDGEVVSPHVAVQLWRYYKPAGLVCTHADEQGRPTVFDALPAELGRVISVGRLDLNSEGLLLLTNSGELARSLEHPDSGHARIYRVRVRGTPSEEALSAMRAGVTIDGIRYRPIEIEHEKAGRSNSWWRVTLREGKNREIRRLFEHFGHPVSRLIRIAYAGITLEGLQPGGVELVPDASKRLKQDGIVRKS